MENILYHKLAIPPSYITDEWIICGTKRIITNLQALFLSGVEWQMWQLAWDILTSSIAGIKLQSVLMQARDIQFLRPSDNIYKKKTKKQTFWNFKTFLALQKFETARQHCEKMTLGDTRNR